jgi:putative ABC transport system permease protein
MKRLWPTRRTPPESRLDVDRELSFHLDMRIRELVAQGVPPDEARRQAIERFGDYTGSRRECADIDAQIERRTSRTAYLREFLKDIAYAARLLRRAPGFTGVAVLTLALGIGANSAIFSVVHGVLLESLPYRDAGRLHRVRTIYPDGTAYSLSAPDFMSVRQDARVFDQVEAYTTTVFTMTGTGEPREVQGARVSDGLAGLLGWRMAGGRVFERGDFAPGRSRVLILDHGFWLRQFGGASDTVGRSVVVTGEPYVIVGVLAPGARLPAAADAYAPFEYDNTFSASTATGRRSEYLSVIAHAKPDVDPTSIDTDLRRVGTALQSAFKPTNGALTFGAMSLGETIYGDVRTPLLVLLGAVGFVLLVACANVANLLLARASARQQEIAIRAALGAARGRLVRQLVTEALVLGLVGGVLGLLVAYLGTAALVAARPADIPRLDGIRVNIAVVVFTLALSVLTGLIFGLAPALQATGTILKRALRQERGGGTTVSERRVRGALVVAEMALAVVLLTGAGLLIRSFVAMTQVAPGFRADQALTFRIGLQGPAYEKPVQVRSRVEEIETRLRSLPGVEAVGVSTVLPLSGRGSMLGFGVADAPPPPANVNAEIAVASASPAYFRAIGAELRGGRIFTPQDAADAPPVAMINEAAARRWFPGVDPVEKFVLVNTLRIQVVGVIGDVLQRDPSQPIAPQLFIPYAQRTARSIRVVLRSDHDAMAHVPTIRSIIREIDPNLPLLSVRPLTELVTDSVARPRFYMSLLALFAGVALALAATGIFGVMSYSVAQRAREISIRMALGASTSDILRRVVGSGLVLAAAGATVGIGIAVVLGRVIQGQLYGVRPLDPPTLIAVVAVLGVSAIAAAFLPARRASKLDPAAVLR